MRSRSIVAAILAVLVGLSPGSLAEAQSLEVQVVADEGPEVIVVTEGDALDEDYQVQAPSTSLPDDVGLEQQASLDVVVTDGEAKVNATTGGDLANQTVDVQVPPSAPSPPTPPEPPSRPDLPCLQIVTRVCVT